jgi:hypothetical protein
MDAAVITALLGGTIGGLTSGLASWLTQRAQVRAQWTSQEILQRQQLYKEFIEEASKCYIDALQHDKPEIPALVGLYAKIARIRVLSSQVVLEHAEQIEIRICSRVRPSLSCGRWRIAGRSTSFAISVKPAAQNSCRFALNNSET